MDFVVVLGDICLGIHLILGENRKPFLHYQMIKTSSLPYMPDYRASCFISKPLFLESCCEVIAYETVFIL